MSPSDAKKGEIYVATKKAKVSASEGIITSITSAGLPRRSARKRTNIAPLSGEQNESKGDDDFIRFPDDLPIRAPPTAKKSIKKVSTRELAINVDAFHRRFLGALVPFHYGETGAAAKRAVIMAALRNSIEKNVQPSFNKYSSIIEFSNCVMLFVNLFDASHDTRAGEANETTSEGIKSSSFTIDKKDFQKKEPGMTADFSQHTGNSGRRTGTSQMTPSVPSASILGNDEQFAHEIVPTLAIVATATADSHERSQNASNIVHATFANKFQEDRIVLTQHLPSRHNSVSYYPNEFLDNGRQFVWWAPHKANDTTPSIARLLHMKRDVDNATDAASSPKSLMGVEEDPTTQSDPILLFIRLNPDIPYTYCGRATYGQHFDSRPIEFHLHLLDFKQLTLSALLQHQLACLSKLLHNMLCQYMDHAKSEDLSNPPDLESDAMRDFLDVLDEPWSRPTPNMAACSSVAEQQLILPTKNQSTGLETSLTGKPCRFHLLYHNTNF